MDKKYEESKRSSNTLHHLKDPPDMEFVKNYTRPDFQAKSFKPQKCVICDSFFRELTA